MRSFVNQTFVRLRDFESAAVFADLEFEHCLFESCSLSNTHSPSLRSTVRNVRLIDCSQADCFVHAAVLEDVIVDGLRTHGRTLQTDGAVFRHVTLQGRIEYLMTSRLLFAGHATPQEQQTFDEANAAFYRNVDWALDISKGEFKDVDLRGVPARLVRRDPETQVLVTRQSAQLADLSSLKFRDQVTLASLQMFLSEGEADMVYAAPKRDSRFRDRLADIALLRREGIAEPD